MFGQHEEKYQFGFMERVGASLIKMGPMPKHIAVILDGNRRFARKLGLRSVTEGHRLGAAKIDHLIDMLLHLGIKQLTVYVFSIENFKRTREEVDGIMDILMERTKMTGTKREKVKRTGISLEFVGNVEDTPNKELKTSMKRNMLLTKGNSSLRVNVCFIYTGRNEVARGANILIDGLVNGKICKENVTEQVLQETFNLHPTNPVDILLRTSGESRLSDFLIWSAADAYLEFVGETWPEYTFWGLLWTIFRYQSQILFKRMGLKDDDDYDQSKFQREEKKFVEELRKQRWNEMEQCCEMKSSILISAQSQQIMNDLSN